MEANKSISMSDIQRQLYKALVDAYEADKILLDTYGDTVTIKRPVTEQMMIKNSAGTERGPKDEGQEKNLKSTVLQEKDCNVFEAPAHQEFETGKVSVPALHESVQPWLKANWQEGKPQIKEADFHKLRIQDIEDMLLLLMQGKLTNLNVEERLAFNVSLRMFTRIVVIQRRVEDLQLGVEIYQKKLNLTKPDMYRINLR
ncbi:hypothetical protein Tco_0478437 [Tanacetum coccineum]